MSGGDSFPELIQRVRAGDPQAAEDLVREYEPTVRVVVRRRLTDPNLRRVLDSIDICQSILAQFFVRAAAGQFEIDGPEQLLKLLATMARNKITSYARKQQAARRTPPSGPHTPFGAEPVDASSSPSQVAIMHELRERFLEGLSPEERYIVDLRADGRSWTEIAAEVGGTPDGLRMQHTRVIARLTDDLGLDE